MTEESKLSYDPSKLSKPVTQHDEYMYAALVEQRAIRQLLARIAQALEAMAKPTNVNIDLSATGSNAPTKAKK